MKLNKFFMLGMVGLAFAACSNEEEMANDFPNGTGVVSVKLINPALTRTITDPTPGTAGTTTIAIKGDLVVSLYEASDVTAGTPNEGATPKIITINADDVSSSTELKFWNVTKPGLITVSINGGQKSYASIAIETSALQSKPESIPAYGETTDFTLTGDTDSPVIANDNDNTSGGNKTEQGAVEGDQNKTYQLYEASVNMAIPVARLEVSGITHVDDEEATCEYTTLTIAGAYMDNLYTQGGTYSENDDKYSAATGPQDYCWDVNGDDAENSLGTGIDAVLKDAISGIEAERSFLTGTWPAGGDAFAYNFYAGTENPVFKIYFDTSVGADSSNPKPAPRFAMVKQYIGADGREVTFENGKIYRITKAELADGNIIGDEGGNTLYGVVVTVTEATWSIVDIDAVWEGSN